MASDFVVPKVDRLTLSNGRWVDVKHRLNAGEQRRVYGRMVKEMQAGVRPTLNPEMVGLTRLSEYIVGWSMTDGRGPVPVSEAAIDNLDPDLFNEIDTALNAHEERVDAERAAEKNDRDGVSTSSAISPSPSSVAGALSGSVN